MPILAVCPHCDWKGRVKDELGGRLGKCPTCGEQFYIPVKGTPPPMPGAKSIDDSPDVVDDAEVVEERRRPKWERMSRKADGDEDDDEVRPARSRRRADDDEDDDRPRPSKRYAYDDDEDDRPRPRRRPADDDEDRPRRRRRRRRVEPSGPNMKMVGGGIVLLIIMIVWWVVGLIFFDLCFYWPPIGSIIAIVTIVRGLMGARE
jgi:hypothetical protein